EMLDLLPYVPRIDLWYNANSLADTLPERHKGRTQDEISRAEGWALHKIVPEFLKVRNPEDNLHRAIGLYSLKETVYTFKFSSNIEIDVKRQGDSTHVEYHTPKGMVSTTTTHTEEMKRAGASITWVEEHIIKKPEDYRVVGYLFENIEVIPKFDDFVEWKDETGEDGVAVTMASLASSPMHHIQKDFLDATDFYYHYNDNRKAMQALAESVEHCYDQMLKIIADSPAEAVLWGGNYDDMITYPPYFEKEIMPWIKKAAETLEATGKIVIGHCDGENQGLMELIRDSGIHVAEAVCPHPMTKVKIEEYYQRWGDKITIFGGIPETLLLEETATDVDLKDYMDNLFQVVAPGRRLILGVADTTPPHAVFDRLIRLGERIEKEGRLPLEGGAFRPISGIQLEEATTRITPRHLKEETFKDVQDDIFKGSHIEIKGHVQALLDDGIAAQDILHKGMLSTMEVIGERFKTGDVFIPEVLLSARAMNEALTVLEPHLASDEKKAAGKVMIGTVRGDLHDIGKNMVCTMLRGVGFEVRDMGINIPTETIVQQVEEYRPDILGLSALLTTTMPQMKKIIDDLGAKGLRSDMKIMVGGAPVNEKFARDIGADGYAPGAGEAITVAKELLKPNEGMPKVKRNA
ncbi:MAG: cobalamin-dependent protein, partial [Desulfatiglandales bacterium]